jgi:hypothetical protein
MVLSERSPAAERGCEAFRDKAPCRWVARLLPRPHCRRRLPHNASAHSKRKVSGAASISLENVQFGESKSSCRSTIAGCVRPAAVNLVAGGRVPSLGASRV